MILVDKDIYKLIADKVIYRNDNYSEELMRNAVGAIGIDLHAEYFANAENHNMHECKLNPGETIFVGCNECVQMPTYLAAKVVLRNSRIRQGFQLEAPVYQPGHRSRVFYRLTNISDKVITLNRGESFAALMFEQLTSEPLKPYNDTFQDELDFSDMASYGELYKKHMKTVEEKVDALKDMEKSVYTNTITLMSIFIALFSIINVNIDLAFAKKIEQSRLVISNLVTVGSIAFLVALARGFVDRKKKEIIVSILLMILSIGLLGLAIFLVWLL